MHGKTSLLFLLENRKMYLFLHFWKGDVLQRVDDKGLDNNLPFLGHCSICTSFRSAYSAVFALGDHIAICQYQLNGTFSSTDYHKPRLFMAAKEGLLLYHCTLSTALNTDPFTMQARQLVHMVPSADVIWNGLNTEPWGTSGIISVWMCATHPLIPSFTSFLYSHSQWTTLVAFGCGDVVTFSSHIDATTSGNGSCPKQWGGWRG